MFVILAVGKSANIREVNLISILIHTHHTIVSYLLGGRKRSIQKIRKQ